MSTPTSGAGYRTLHQPGDKFEFLVRRPSSAARARAERVLVRAAWRELWPVFGTPPPSLDGPRAPFEIVFVRALPDGDDGRYEECCGHLDTASVFIDRDLNRATFTATLLHELFHAFQSAAMGRLAEDDWWQEASATWYEGVTAPTTDLDDFDRHFLQAPGVPLDDFAEPFRHSYGAWRFLQWLARDQGWSVPATLRFASESFRLRGPDPAGNETPALRAALSRAGADDLGTLLGRFWGSRLGPDGPGPATRGEPHQVEEGSGRLRYGGDIRPLAAKVVRFRAAAGLRELFFELEERPDPDAKVWILAGGRSAREWLPLEAESFCIRPELPTAEREWPGEFALAITNAGEDPLADLTIEVSGSSAPCQPLVPTPIGSGCPPTPRAWRPPAGFTSRIVFAYRLGLIDAQWGAWYRAISGESPPGVAPEYATLATIRRQAELARCTAGRLNGLDRVPDGFRRPLARAIGGFAEIAAGVDDAGDTCAREIANGSSCDWIFASERVNPVVRRGHPLFAAMHLFDRGAALDRPLTREWRRCRRLPRSHRCRGPSMPPRWFESPI